MDPNPTSFLPLFVDPYNSTNLSTIIHIYHQSLSISKLSLPPTSDNNTIWDKSSFLLPLEARNFDSLFRCHYFGLCSAFERIHTRAICYGYRL